MEIIWHVGAVAELTRSIVAPAPKDSVSFRGTRMVIARADGIPVIACADLCGSGALRGGAVAELTVIVVTPAPESVVGFGGTSMRNA